MNIRFNFKGAIFGQKEALVLALEEKATVIAALKALTQQVPSLGGLIFRGDSLRSDILVIVDRTDVISMGLLEMELEEGQEIALLPLAHGGKH